MKAIILELEEKLRLAMCNSDIATLDRLLSNQLIFTNHLGQVTSKDQDINSHKNKIFVVRSIVLSNMKILELGDSAVATTQAEISGEYNGVPTSGNFRFTRVWSKTHDHWEVVSAHSCLIT